MPPELAPSLLQWFDSHQRAMPWRIPPGADRTANPYHILLSECMLQQTQVATVIPYFNRFIARYPTLTDLAAADLHDVLHLWQGLGYYSRARNLLKSAQFIMHRLGGQIPQTAAELLQLPGVGRYTAAAIASIAFGQPVAVLDGNVMRVLCRLDAISADPREKHTNLLLWRRAQQFVPARRPGDFNAAMMELGALICTSANPQCLLCPVQRFCQGLRLNLVAQIPPPKPRQAIPTVYRHALFLQRHTQLWLHKRPDRGRWAGLWQLPTLPTTQAQAQTTPTEGFAISIPRLRYGGQVKHSLTHRHYVFSLWIGDMPDALPPARPDQLWVQPGQITQFALSRPQQKLIALALTSLQRDRLTAPKTSQ